MAAHELIIYQPYTLGKRGAVIAGQGIACRDQSDACRRAEKAIAAGQIVGAHVVKIIVDEEAGDYSEPDYLAVLGTVPEPAE